MIIVRRRLTQQDGEDLISRIEEWFKENPRRRVCRTEYFNVRRKHVIEDIMEHTQKEVKNGNE